MSALTDTYLVVRTGNAEYFVDQNHYCGDPPMLFGLFGSSDRGWYTFQSVEGGLPVHVRRDAITSYYLSTPEQRQLYTEWCGAIDPDRESWQQ